MHWSLVDRPGYFGRRKNEIIARLNEEHGLDKWRLVWVVAEGGFRKDYTFFNACRSLYEESYFHYLQKHPEKVDIICSYGECYDNDPENVKSGLDYMQQHAYSTHIQDIAVRNALRRLDRWFTGPPTKLLQIRSNDSNGYWLGPGNIPLFRQGLITTPSKCPKWANEGSVEDFWQSNKWVQVQSDKPTQEQLL